MEFYRDPAFSSQPTRFHGVRLPASQVDLREVNTILFLLEHGPLEQTLPNLLSTAAVSRAIELQRGSPIQVKVMGETQFWNSLHGVTENHFEQGISPGDHALLLTAASIYKRQMARLVGSYALASATLDGFPTLVDDDVKLGERKDSRSPIRPLVEALVRDSQDPHVRELLRLAAESEALTSQDPTVLACRGALETLQTLSIPFRRRRQEDRPEIIPTLTTMIREWIGGATLPTVCHSFIERHDDAADIAQSIWSSAQEIAPGVFQLIEYPFEETDDVIQDRLKEIYTKDVQARYVLERGTDSPATSLSLKEAVDLTQRLGAGEDPKELLSEVEALMHERQDTSCAVDIAMAELRDRDPKDTLEKILERAHYIPDPCGVNYTVFKSPDIDLFDLMQRHNIPIIGHDTLWLHDLKTETARPFMISFQGQYLQSFLSMIDS